MEKNLKTQLNKHNFAFKKYFGQNFLTDKTLLTEIVDGANITKDDKVLEIGCGAGALTGVLCEKAGSVLGYEIDEKLKPILSENLRDYSNVEIVYKDVMKVDISEIESKLNGEYTLVANLPYYITTPIIMRFLEEAKLVKSLVVMVQQEVGERLVASSGTSDYGAITVSVNLYGSASIIKWVGREMFTPPPNVDSVVVKIDIDRNKYADVDFDSVKKAVKIGFSNRRKMLVNNLMRELKLDRTTVENILTNADISLSCRGETLNEKEYISLANSIKQNG